MLRFQNILTDTSTANADIKAYQLIGYDDFPISADDQPVQGFAYSPAKTGELYSITLIGTCEAKTNGVVNKGDKLITAADGGVKKAPDNALNVFAKALSTGANGEYVRYLLQ